MLGVVFVADFATAQDRAMTLLMLVGGLGAIEVRGLRLSDVDPLTLRVRRSLPRGLLNLPVGSRCDQPTAIV